MSDIVELSVIVPVYGCRDCIGALYERLVVVLAACTASFEIVLIDDCAPDDAWAVLRSLERRDPRVRPYRLSRNFGQHAAITAGLEQCRGRWAVVVDPAGRNPSRPPTGLCIAPSLPLSRHADRNCG